MKKVARITWYASILMFGFSSAWLATNYFMHWDEIISPKGWWKMNWQPLLFMFVGYIGFVTLKERT